MFNIKIKEKIYMKKTYINPTLKVVKTKGARLLAGSGNQLMGMRGDYKSGTVTMGSRRSSFSDWDEDE